MTSNFAAKLAEKIKQLPLTYSPATPKALMIHEPTVATLIDVALKSVIGVVRSLELDRVDADHYGCRVCGSKWKKIGEEHHTPDCIIRDLMVEG